MNLLIEFEDRSANSQKVIFKQRKTVHKEKKKTEMLNHNEYISKIAAIVEMHSKHLTCIVAHA